MGFFVSALIGNVILLLLVLGWAKWARLDLGWRRPAIMESWHWIALFVLWIVIEQAIDFFFPVAMVEDEIASQMQRMSFYQWLILGVILGPIVEELMFRGAMFSWMLRRWGLWAAAIVPSLLWGLTHTQYEDLWYVASIAGSGVVLAMIRWKSGSIVTPLALHALFNLGVIASAEAFAAP